MLVGLHTHPLIDIIDMHMCLGLCIGHVSSYYMHMFICFIISELQYNHNLGVIKLIDIQEIGWKTLIMLHGKHNYTCNWVPCIVFWNLFKASGHYTNHMWYLQLKISCQYTNSCDDCSTILKSIWSPKSSWQPITWTLKIHSYFLI